jgi:DNA-binding winged helix-turn-helix (wHTH) protein
VETEKMDTTNEEVAVLVAQAGPLNGQRWALRHSLVIGREPSCDIVIPDRQVSRHHARFSIVSAGVQLEDLGSKNGTHRNGQTIAESVLLQDGDMIQVALAQQFVFLSSDATVPLDSDVTDFQAFRSPQAASQASASGRLRLEKRSRRVWIGDLEVLPPLSVSQFRLLEILYSHQGKVVSRQDLIADVWGEDQAVDVSEQALDALIRRLRDRLASIDPTHQYIITVRGHGLRLDNPTKR